MRGFGLNFVVAAMLVAFMIAASGCCGATGQVAQNSAAPQNAQVQAPPKEVADENVKNLNVENGEVGKTYTVNYLNSKYDVTLKEAEFAASTNPYISGNYLMAYFEIKNVGDGSEFFFPKIYALDSEGEKYDNTIAIGLGDKYGKTLDFAKELPPNTKMSGWTAIKIPASTASADLYFEYTNSLLSKTPNYIKYKVVG